GFSGGRKAIMPGICGFETLKVLHGADAMAHEKAVEGIIEGNHFHEDILHVAKTVRVDFILNVTLNERREITGIFTGELEKAHMEGVRFMETQCVSTVDEPVDVVITTSAGFPLDLTFYQAIKGMTAAQGIVREGGVIIIAAKCAEGIGSPEFTRLMLETESVDAFLTDIRKPGYHIVDQWQFQKFCIVLEKHEVWMYSDGIDHITQEKLFVTPLESVEQGLDRVLERFGENARIAVIPEGPYVLAKLS
ncbi:lactate racemase domain-containing protein, partial [Candidatus Latescibacterota bacterium]